LDPSVFTLAKVRLNTVAFLPPSLKDFLPAQGRDIIKTPPPVLDLTTVELGPTLREEARHAMRHSTREMPDVCRSHSRVL
jgi:hypothetical protein